jgi:hypothetical protein
MVRIGAGVRNSTRSSPPQQRTLQPPQQVNQQPPFQPPQRHLHQQNLKPLHQPIIISRLSQPATRSS